MIDIKITPQQRAEIDAHWAKARAGLHQDQPHEYGTDHRQTADMHRDIAIMHITRARDHMGRACELEVTE